MPDEDVVGPGDVLIDHAGLERQQCVWIGLATEEPRFGPTEPRVDEDRPIAEANLPAVRAEPSEIDAGGSRPTTRRCRLSALSHARRQHRIPCLDEICRHSDAEATPEKSVTRDARRRGFK